MPFHPLRGPAFVSTLGYAFCAIFTAAFGAEPPTTEGKTEFAVSFDREKPVYGVNEPVRVTVRMTRNGRPVAHGRFHRLFEGDAEINGTAAVDTDPDGRAVIETKLSRPGVIRARLHESNPKEKTAALFGFAVAPADIRSARPRPGDFDAYWDGVLAELQALPFEATVTPRAVDEPYAARVASFDVRLNTLGAKPFIHGNLCLPQGAAPGTLPIVMHYHGAGFRSSRAPAWDADKGRLAFDINAHGLPDGRPDDYYREIHRRENDVFRTHGADNRDTIYFRDMIVRAVRALQWLKTRPEWDGRTVIVNGTSQGGGQAFAVAALDPDVTLCLAAVPTFCDHGGALIGRDSGWPNILPAIRRRLERELRAKPTPERLEPFARACDYVDNAFFAARVKDGTAMRVSLGYLDGICPPVGVYAAYNALSVPDRILFEDTASGHQPSPATVDAFAQAAVGHIAKMKTAPKTVISE